jgi:hypothetical protein
VPSLSGYEISLWGDRRKILLETLRKIPFHCSYNPFSVLRFKLFNLNLIYLFPMAF